MARWDYKSIFIYSNDGSLLSSEEPDGTVTDGKGDTTFETSGDGDCYSVFVALLGATVVFDYVGQAVFDGELVPVGHSPLYDVYAFGPTRDGTSVTAPTTAIVPPADTGAFDTVCFGAGTGIATPTGRRPVETLAIGDAVLTADGRVVPVMWIGRQSVATQFRPAKRLRMVRIAAGGLGHGLPERDLTVTADHGMLLGDALVNAGALVNGVTVMQVPRADLGPLYTACHIATEAHEVIRAEGAAAESFIDYVGRQAFDNHAEYVALYGETDPGREMGAPRITSARHLPRGLKTRLGMASAA